MKAVVLAIAFALVSAVPVFGATQRDREDMARMLNAVARDGVQVSAGGTTLFWDITNSNPQSVSEITSAYDRHGPEVLCPTFLESSVGYGPLAMIRNAGFVRVRLVMPGPSKPPSSKSARRMDCSVDAGVLPDLLLSEVENSEPDLARLAKGIRRMDYPCSKVTDTLYRGHSSGYPTYLVQCDEGRYSIAITPGRESISVVDCPLLEAVAGKDACKWQRFPQDDLETH